MKILVIGCGSIGQRHIRNLLRIKAGEILAFDIDEDKLKEVGKISGGIKKYGDLEKVWEEKPRAAFITVPTALHIKYAVEAAKRGCHLFIEKPLSHNSAGLSLLSRIAREKGLVVFVGYNFRFNDCLVRIKSLLRKKAIGNIVGGRCHFGSYLPERHPWEDYRKGYGARNDLGGGAILDAMSHQIDYFIFLLGRPAEILCYSTKSSGLDIDVEDTVESLVKFGSGELISLHADFIQRPYKHTVELLGEKGTIFCDLVTNILRIYDLKKRQWIEHKGSMDPNEVYVKEAGHFLRSIRRKAVRGVNLKGGVDEVKILTAFKRSAMMNQWVKI